jgi:hypothetical protein
MPAEGWGPCTAISFSICLRTRRLRVGRSHDYAQLVKIYGQAPEGQRRYSPPVIVGTETNCCTGNPDKAHISTSYLERQNLSMRMGIRRFTRLTNAFSKKVENHAHAIAIYFMHYNFVRIQSEPFILSAPRGALQSEVPIRCRLTNVRHWETATSFAPAHTNNEFDLDRSTFRGHREPALPTLDRTRT